MVPVECLMIAISMQLFCAGKHVVFSNNKVLCMENDRNTCERRLRFFFPVTVLRPFVNLTDALVVRLGTQLGR